jgi:hypothetical protein
MYEVRAICESSRCERNVFTVKRRSIVKKSTSGQPYTINQVACPRCRMWARVSTIKEVSK